MAVGIWKGANAMFLGTPVNYRKIGFLIRAAMKIAVHLHHCQSTAKTATHCNANACANFLSVLILGQSCGLTNLHSLSTIINSDEFQAPEWVNPNYVAFRFDIVATNNSEFLIVLI